jgi:hypothetical protein
MRTAHYPNFLFPDALAVMVLGSGLADARHAELYPISGFSISTGL